ncbi:MAG: winged helix-turn-helix domain-containing protein [Caldilineaceae bacterium]|nr:winged helix-turn-helix domain-containing protein [Caldilineaceae bacterium]
MTETKFCPRRLLWVDAQPSALDQAGRYFQAHHLAVRFVDNFEEALVEVDTWLPHLLLLDYDVPTSAMAYETFVHARLPLVDPYRMTGPLADNPWRYAAIPILLVSGGPPVTIPGFVAPHLHRVAHFVPKPFEPSHLLPLVEELLPERHTGIILDPDQGCVEVQGIRQAVSERPMDLLMTLARHHPRPLKAAQLVRHLSRERGVLTSESAVRTALSSLRRQLEGDGLPSLVDTRHNGYCLTRPPTLTSE